MLNKSQAIIRLWQSPLHRKSGWALKGLLQQRVVETWTRHHFHDPITLLEVMDSLDWEHRGVSSFTLWEAQSVSYRHNEVFI